MVTMDFPGVHSIMSAHGWAIFSHGSTKSVFTGKEPPFLAKNHPGWVFLRRNSQTGARQGDGRCFASACASAAISSIAGTSLPC
jgi:hypothetical protein